MSVRDFEYAVIDLETTGVFAEGNDRICEISIQRVSGQGDLLREYTTLVNPERDLGPQHIHQITSIQVLHAPKFEDIVGDIISLLTGAVLVAHNVSFERRFLRSGFERLGINAPEFVEFCTLNDTSNAFPNSSSRKLGDLCAHLNIPLTNPHCAEDDAVACSKVMLEAFSRYESNMPTCINRYAEKFEEVSNYSWPKVTLSNIRVKRESKNATIERASQRMELFLSKLPLHQTGNPNKDAYLELLVQILEDRVITDDEFEHLATTAEKMNLSRDETEILHHRFVKEVIATALQDDIITEAERNDIVDVAMVFGYPESEIPNMIAMVQDEKEVGGHADVLIADEDLNGLTVCFTGQLLSIVEGKQMTRSLAEEICLENGLRPQSGVTKKLDILVVADPHSQSGKAKKARKYDVRIIAERQFWKMLGLDVN